MLKRESNLFLVSLALWRGIGEIGESTEPKSMELESKEPELREVFRIWGVAEKLQVDQRKQV